MAKASGTTKTVGSNTLGVTRKASENKNALYPTTDSIIKRVGTTPSVSELASYFKEQGFKVVNNYESVAHITTPSGKVTVVLEENNPKYSNGDYEMKATIYSEIMSTSFFDRQSVKREEIPYIRSGELWKKPEIHAGQLQKVLNEIKKWDK